MNKAVQDTGIPVKIFNENAKYFAKYIFPHINEAICTSNVPASFKFANITPALNKVLEIKRITIGQPACYLLSPKYLKSLFVDNFQIKLIIFFQNFNGVLEKAIVSNILLL